MHVFEVKIKSGRKIRLTKERWKHITTRHPFMTIFLDKLEETLKNPDNIIQHKKGELFDFYKHYKHGKQNLKFLKVVVKYLNGDGFVLSSYFVRRIN